MVVIVEVGPEILFIMVSFNVNYDWSGGFAGAKTTGQQKGGLDLLA